MKGLLLLSGGIDSPVAARLLQERGMELAAVHFSLAPFSDDTPEEKSLHIAETMGLLPFLVVPHGNLHAEITKACSHRYYYVLSRRLMLRTAEVLAKEYGCEVLVTGDNLGQVGSQTLPNMAVITQAVSMPIFRPLLCLDKVEIIDLAKEFGTYDVSVGPEMCSVLGPKHPATASKLYKIEEEETQLDIGRMVDEGIKSARKVL